MISIIYIYEYIYTYIYKGRQIKPNDKTECKPIIKSFQGSLREFADLGRYFTD